MQKNTLADVTKSPSIIIQCVEIMHLTMDRTYTTSLNNRNKYIVRDSTIAILFTIWFAYKPFHLVQRNNHGGLLN